ncbi:DUF2946 family protein [Tropicimonas marinistellae]|uniref:DUF2946 family protein n=1 Tax=Tropicimonas marinistellae TaxID=1739787 RepID=UPI00082D5B80|nr:hypothetical protein [Tropicimonas marinistellae]
MLPQKEKAPLDTLPTRGVRLAIIAVFLLALMLQAINPVRGLAQQDGTLIEICSEFGVAKVRVDAEGNIVETSGTPCPKCEDCALCCADVASAAPNAGTLHSPIDLPSIEPARVRTSDTENPAQFWADNRGPPVRTPIEIGPAMELFMASPWIEGRTPWT